MKTYNNKPAASKLLKSFDNQLKNILMADLKNFRESNQFLISNNQPAQQKAA